MRYGMGVVACLFASGCFAVADLDRFEQNSVGVVVDLDGFEDFAGERVELRLVNADNVIEVRAVIEDMPADGSHLFVLPFGLETADRRFDLYVDADGDELFTEGGAADAGDPSWQRPLDDDGYFAFTVDDARQSIGDPPTMPLGEDFVLDITDLRAHTDGMQALEMLVVNLETGLPVGYYYLSDVNAVDITVAIPGIIESGVPYRVDFFADKSQNGVYDPPPTDHTWTVRYEGTPSGIQETFPHNADFVDVAASFPEP